MKKQNKIRGEKISSDTFFYTIAFEGGEQQLTREVLAKHYDIPKERRAYAGNQVEFKDFKHGLLAIAVKLSEGSQNMIHLRIGLTELDITCTCGMPDQKLCRHAFIGLHNLAWWRGLDWKQYYWPGITDDDRIKNKFLLNELNKYSISVKPRAKYGNLFKANIGFEGDEKLVLKQSVSSENLNAGGKEAMAYCLAHNYGNYSNSHLPVLIPCLGITSKNNQAILSFKKFHRRDKPVTGCIYNSNQQALNEICFDQYDIAIAHSKIDQDNQEERSG